MIDRELDKKGMIPTHQKKVLEKSKEFWGIQAEETQKHSNIST